MPFGASEVFFISLKKKSNRMGASVSTRKLMPMSRRCLTVESDAPVDDSKNIQRSLEWKPQRVGEEVYAI